MARETEVEFLPDGADTEFEDGDDGIDYGSMRLNITQQEADSSAPEYDLMPSGTYPVTITAIELGRSKTKKNLNKPFWKMTLVVREGHKFENRRIWTNVMLFEGALYSYAQLVKALGLPADGRVPHPDSLIGESVAVTLKVVVDTYKLEKMKEADEWKAGDAIPKKNEVGGFKSLFAGNAAGKTMPGEKDPMLP